VVRSWVRDGRYSKSHSGTHRVGPEAAAELGAHMEAKFHMHCFYFT
jgi:hypothetical protein